MTAAPFQTQPLLPRRAPASPIDETERLADYALTDDRLLGTVLEGLVAGDLDACPGILVVHADGSTECVEADDCPRDPVLHTGSTTCADAGLDCC